MENCVVPRRVMFLVMPKNALDELGPYCGPLFSAANFSRFHGPVFQIPWLTAANFPHVVINGIRLPKPDQTGSICKS